MKLTYWLHIKPIASWSSSTQYVWCNCLLLPHCMLFYVTIYQTLWVTRPTILWMQYYYILRTLLFLLLHPLMCCFFFNYNFFCATINISCVSTWKSWKYPTLTMKVFISYCIYSSWPKSLVPDISSKHVWIYFFLHTAFQTNGLRFMSVIKKCFLAN